MMTDEQFKNAYDNYTEQATQYSKNFPLGEQAQRYGMKFGELCEQMTDNFTDLIAFQRWKHKRLSKIKQDELDEVNKDLVRLDKIAQVTGGCVDLMNHLRLRKKEHFVMKLHSENMIKLFTAMIEHGGDDDDEEWETDGSGEVLKHLKTVNQGIHLVIEVLGEAVEKNIYSENDYIQLCKQFKEEYEMWAGSIEFFTKGSLVQLGDIHRRRFGYDL